MQPGYGIPELQQFMADGSSLFTLSNDLNPSPQQKNNHQNLQLQLQQQQQQQQQQTRGYQYHQFQPFLEFPTLQQPRWVQQQQPPPALLHPQSPPPHLVLEAEHAGNPPSRLLPFISNFKPVVNINETGCSRERHHFADEEASLGDEPGSDRRWPREEGGGVKSPNEPVRGPFWVSDLAFNNNSNRLSTSTDTKRYRKDVEESDPPALEGKGSNAGTGYRKFGELEAIYNVNFYGGGELQGGSGSALTGDNAPPAAGKPILPRETEGTQASETLADDEEASLRKSQKKRKKKKRQQQQMASIASFFEKLVNQLMDHQETLHKRFMEVMEKRDKERQNREEEWRLQEAARLSREKTLRAQEEAAVSSRENAIVSFLEKITGETLVLPKRDTLCSGSMPETTQPENSETERRNEAGNSNRRWPKSEVNALIKVRSGLEARFQEPGLKGPLWEEVSSAMAAMGYCRSAKRCKEKWENINKYFRKTKNNVKRRSQRSKTCPYFQQLDLLYTNKASASSAGEGTGIPSNSEFLDAILPIDGRGPKLETGALLGSHVVAETIDRGTSKDLLPLNCSENENDEEEEDGEDEEDEEEDDGNDEEQAERGGQAKVEEEDDNMQCTGSFMELVHNLAGNSTTNKV